MKRKITGALAGFLALVFLFTLISRAADGAAIARVTVQSFQRGKITHTVSGQGKVVQNREQAVSTLPGQVVKTIFVEEGQQVEKGELLFEIDLDVLKEQILEKKQEMEIADLQAQDRQSSLDAQARQEAVEQDRAAQDYSAAEEKSNTMVGRAAQELNSARAKLQSAGQDSFDQTDGDAVQKVLQETCDQKKIEYDLAVEYEKELEQEIDELVREALAQTQPSAETPFFTEALPDTEDAAPAEASNTQASAPEGDMDIQAQCAAQTEAEILVGGETETPQIEHPRRIEQRIREENQPLLDKAREQILLKEKEKADADAALQEHMQKMAAQAQTADSAAREQLAQEVRAKEQAYNDAVTAANDSMRAAGRAVEDASAPRGTDSTAQIDAITKEQRELQLAKLEELFEAGGRVCSPIDGVVMRISLTTGDRTPDGTAVLLSDRESGNKLVVQVPEEQEQYIARGDAVKVKTGQKNVLEGLSVDYVCANEEDKTLLDVAVQLPQDSLEAGVYAVMESVRSSETYDCCVPVQALYADNGKYFVYVLSQTESVLGTELSAQRVDVTVLDKNETNAALQGGSIGYDQKVIVASDKMLSQGSRVRLQE